MSKSVILPDSVTGRGDMVINPANVLAMFSDYGSATITMLGGVELKLKPEFKDKDTSLSLGKRVRDLLFTPAERDQMAALPGFNLGGVNPSAVVSLQYEGGNIIAVMTDGTRCNTVRPATFPQYRAAFACLYGQDAANDLQPAQPTVVVYQPKAGAMPAPKPASKPAYKPPTDYEGFMAEQSRHADAELPAYHAPSVSGPAAVLGVVARLEIDLVQLMGVGEYADGASVCEARLQTLTRAALQYQKKADPDTAAAVVRAAENVTAATARLPQTYTTARFRENARSLAEMAPA